MKYLFAINVILALVIVAYEPSNTLAWSGLLGWTAAFLGKIE